MHAALDCIINVHKMLYIVYVISQNVVYCICYFTKCCILYIYICYFSVISVDTDVEYELQGLGYAHDVVLHAHI